MSPVRLPLTYLLALAAVFALLFAPARASAQSGGAHAPGTEKKSAKKKRTSSRSSQEEEPAGGPTLGGGASPDALPDDPNAPVGKARLSRDGRTAIAPVDAPPEVKAAIEWANRITRKHYRYGGGHRRFRSSSYDCSGAISYALRGARLLDSPLHSRAFFSWGKRGRGDWITVYTSHGHAYVVIAGLRFDTSAANERRARSSTRATRESGPRWRTSRRSSRGYRARHIPGL